MATRSSILAGRIPWTEKPGGLWSIGLQSGFAQAHGCEAPAEWWCFDSEQRRRLGSFVCVPVAPALRTVTGWFYEMWVSEWGARGGHRGKRFWHTAQIKLLFFFFLLPSLLNRPWSKEELTGPCVTHRWTEPRAPDPTARNVTHGACLIASRPRYWSVICLPVLLIMYAWKNLCALSSLILSWISKPKIPFSFPFFFFFSFQRENGSNLKTFLSSFWWTTSCWPLR